MKERGYGEIPTLKCRKESFDAVDKNKRYQQIIECLSEIGEMSARELASYMCLKGYIPTAERNYTSPRLNELCAKGIVEQVGRKVCKVTGRTVTVFKLCE